MTSKWRLAARAAIQKAIAALPPDCERSQLKKSIDQAYPFGFREYYPYKVWLDERKHYFYQLGISTNQPNKKPKPRKSKLKREFIPTGQLTLFDM